MNSPEKAVEKEKPVCFVIMPISDVHGYEPGHFGRVYEHVLKPAIVAAGYLPMRADDTIKTDYIVVGIIEKIVESEMVICDLSARNPNVMYELGIRHAFNIVAQTKSLTFRACGMSSTKSPCALILSTRTFQRFLAQSKKQQPLTGKELTP